MTTDPEVTTVRRSQRIQKLSQSQSVVYDDHIDKSDYEGGEDHEEEEDDDDDDDPEVRPGSSATKRRKKSKRGPKSSNKRAKRATSAIPAGRGTFDELRREFEEHYLFQALNDAEASIAETANDWVEEYKSNKDLAKKDLVNFLLNAVGCFTKIEEHDVNNSESASETVGEIEAFFKRQKVHEFYLLSKKPEYKHLKKNFVDFINQIMITSNERGVLYENIVFEEDEEAESSAEEGNIVEDLLVWLSAMSVSSIRPLRYISSLSLFSIESTLCTIIKKNNASLETFKRQLETEEKKKKTAAIKKRVEQIQKNVDTFSNQSIILENFIQDIVNTAFIHRFKDTDHLIRAEAMISLGNWMDSYPEFFFKVTYLKYLGWVLSDSNSTVRLQVIKTLIKLLKHHSVVAGLRQFLERFKNRIIDIAFYDVDHTVRINAIALLTEVNKTGFLEDEEVSIVLSLIYHKNDKKVLSQLANFLQTAEKEKTNEILEANETRLQSFEEDFPLSLEAVLKIKTLINLLTKASEVELSKSKNSLIKTSRLDPSPIALFAKVFLSLSHYDDIGEVPIQYFLMDISSVDTIEESVKSIIELTNDEEDKILQLIHGYLLHLNEKDDETATKLRARKEENNNDSSIQVVISYLPVILNRIEHNEGHFAWYFNIFQSFKISLFEYSSAEIGIFKSIHSTFLKYFKNSTVESLKDQYIRLFKSLKNSSNFTMISDVVSTYQDYTSELIIEFRNYLNDSEFDLLNPNYDEIYLDYTSKLLILGMFFNIVELLNEFKTFQKKLFSLLTDIEIDNNTKITSVFQLLVSATSWRLNHLLNSNEIYNLEVELAYVPDLIQDLVDILVDEKDHFPLGIKSGISVVYLDVLILLSNFFHAYEESGKDNIANVNRFREIELNSLVLSNAVLSSLRYIFLAKEAILGNVLDVELERDEDEDVNLNSLQPDLGNLDENELIWEVEKDLIIYTKKLLSMKKLELISDEFVNRIKLNSNVLGDLFKTVVDEELNDEQEEEEEEIVQSQAIENDVNEDDIDEIENDDDIPEIQMED